MAPTLKPVSEGVPSISGSWTLERNESNDVKARLQPVVQKIERDRRKYDRRVEAGSERPLDMPPDLSPPPDMPPELSTMYWLRQQRMAEFEQIYRLLSAAPNLQITQSAREIRIASDKGDGTQILVPGEISALFMSLGGFEMSSGWSKGSFVVHSKGTGENRIDMVESYAVTADGQQLTKTLTVKVPELGKHEFKFVYKKAWPTASS